MASTHFLSDHRNEFSAHVSLQVVVQHGGRVADSYDQNECTHLLALHKKSDVFVKVH